MDEKEKVAELLGKVLRAKNLIEALEEREETLETISLILGSLRTDLVELLSDGNEELRKILMTIAVEVEGN